MTFRLTKMQPRRVLFVLLAALSLIVAGAAAAQPAMPLPERAMPALSAETAAEVERLVETLEDEGRRTQLIEQLKALLAVQAPEPAGEPGFGTWLLQDLSARTGKVSRQVVDAAATVTDLPQVWAWVEARFSQPQERAALLRLAAEVGAVIAVALLAGWLVRRTLAGAQRSIEARRNEGFGVTAVFLLLRTVLDLIPIVAFGAAAYGALTVVDPPAQGRVVALAFVNAVIIARGLSALARMVLVPHVSALRLLSMSDETANYLYLWFRRLTNVTVYGYFAIQAMSLLGLPAAAYDTLLKFLGLAVGLLLVMLVLQNRRPVASAIRGGEGATLSVLRRRAAEVWHVFAILYLVAVFGVWVLDVPGGYQYVVRATLLSAVIIVFARVVLLALDRLIDRVFSLSDDLKRRLPELEVRANRYLPVVHKGAHWVVFVVAGLAVLQIWGLDALLWFATDAVGQEVLRRLVTIGLVVVIGLLVWEVFSAAIEAYLSRQDADGNAVARSQRLQTLLPLLRNALMIVLLVLVVLTVLSELGLNIGPLLAGAGVVGLAIGFGAQTLVKDVITGLFILIEDSIHIGDVVQVAGHSGRVEALSIRTLRLRDLEGTVHTIPFSEVTSVKNLTKDFSYALMDIGVAYREDVDEVIEVIKDVGREIREDPEQGLKIVEDMEVLGLDRFDDSAVVIRVRLKTLPLQQWGVRRAFNRLLKRRFDAEGIEIPFPHQTVYFGVDKDGSAPPANLRLQRQTGRKGSQVAAEEAGEGDDAPAPAQMESGSPPGGAGRS